MTRPDPMQQLIDRLNASIANGTAVDPDVSASDGPNPAHTELLRQAVDEVLDELQPSIDDVGMRSCPTCVHWGGLTDANTCALGHDPQSADMLAAMFDKQCPAWRCGGET